jgi:HK97 family phage prohead protease
MDETRELGMALVKLRREAHQQRLDVTKDLDPLPIKADGGEGVLSGYASVYWVVDSYGECTAPGSFTRSVAERGPKGSNRIPFRYEHEHTIGTHTAIDTADTHGLAIEAQVVDDGMYGTVLRRHLDAGVPYGISIGFRNLRGRAATPEDPLIWDFAPRWLRENPDPGMVYVLEEIKLMENSGVTFPAVEPARIETYKADPGQHLERVLASVKAGALTPTQIGLLREIAAALPAATAPETGQEPAQPGAKADSSDDALIAELDVTLALFERHAA